MTRILTIYVDKSIVGDTAEELFSLYGVAAEKHNNTVRGNKYPDAGFDILTPTNGVQPAGYILNGQHMQFKLMTGVRCSMEEYDGKVFESEAFPMSYYMYSRSSISKTQYRLANNVGIIDSGYRGQLIAVFDLVPNQEKYTMPEAYSRLVQVCCGDLRPFYVVVKMINSNDVDNLVTSTTRGDGGFGSTGN